VIIIKTEVGRFKLSWFSCSHGFLNYLAFRYLALIVPNEGYFRNVLRH